MKTEKAENERTLTVFYRVRKLEQAMVSLIFAKRTINVLHIYVSSRMLHPLQELLRSRYDVAVGCMYLTRDKESERI